MVEKKEEVEGEFDQRCHPQGACKGCMWWTFSCVLLEYEKPVVEGAKECKFREGAVERQKWT
jgi:hypothetical protein